MPGFRPGGRLTFLRAQESKQRKRPCKTAHPQGVGALRFSVIEARAKRPPRASALWSNSCAESEVEARQGARLDAL